MKNANAQKAKHAHTEFERGPEHPPLGVRVDAFCRNAEGLPTTATVAGNDGQSVDINARHGVPLSGPRVPGAIGEC